MKTALIKVVIVNLLGTFLGSVDAQELCNGIGLDTPKTIETAKAYINNKGAFIVFRHGEKNTGGEIESAKSRYSAPHELIRDSVPKVCDEDGCVRCKFRKGLKPNGRNQADEIRRGIRNQLTKVFYSPLCRTTETAVRAFGTKLIESNDALEQGSITPLATIVSELNLNLEDRSTYAFVTHSDVLDRFLGDRPSPGQGVGVVLKKGCYPESGHHGCILACVLTDRWQ